jgi:hypothetical protein
MASLQVGFTCAFAPRLQSHDAHRIPHVTRQVAENKWHLIFLDLSHLLSIFWRRNFRKILKTKIPKIGGEDLIGCRKIGGIIIIEARDSPRQRAAPRQGEARSR